MAGIYPQLKHDVKWQGLWRYGINERRKPAWRQWHCRCLARGVKKMQCSLSLFRCAVDRSSQWGSTPSATSGSGVGPVAVFCGVSCFCVTDGQGTVILRIQAGRPEDGQADRQKERGRQTEVVCMSVCPDHGTLPPWSCAGSWRPVYVW